MHILDDHLVLRRAKAGRPGPFVSIVLRRNLMEYKGVEYSVVQLTDGTGWRWEFRFGDGKTKTGISPVSRAAAIRLVQYEIDRILKDKE